MNQGILVLAQRIQIILTGWISLTLAKYRYYRHFSRSVIVNEEASYVELDNQIPFTFVTIKDEVGKALSLVLWAKRGEQISALTLSRGFVRNLSGEH